MSPSRVFYSEANLPIWERTTKHEIMGATGYGFKIKKESNLLETFSMPNETNLGFGRIVIPIRVPKTKRGGTSHPFVESAHFNSLFFNNANRLGEVLDVFDANNPTRTSGGFHFSSHNSIEREWYLIAGRVLPTELPKWRQITSGAEMSKSAAGLVESFNQQFSLGTMEPI